MNYPLRIAHYSLIPGSGGNGRFRGGLGVRRDIEFPFADCSFTIFSDGRKFAPWGLDQGGPGACARYIYDPEGEQRELASKVTITVPKGGRVSVQTPGGGGFGPPATRDPAAALRDRQEGYVQEARAVG